MKGQFFDVIAFLHTGIEKDGKCENEKLQNDERKEKLDGGIHNLGRDQMGQDQKQIHCQKHKGERRLGIKLFQSVSLLFR